MIKYISYIKISFLCSIIINILFVFSIAFSQELSEKPEWVKRHQDGLGIKKAEKYYYGIGESKKSQFDADAKARKEFALSVKVRVQSVFEEEIQQKGRILKEFARMSNKQISDLSLRGLTITERYEEAIADTILKIPFEREYYFSLIKIEKDKYDKLVSDEIERELTIKEKEYEEEIALKRLNEQKRLEELQIEKSKHEREKEEKSLELDKEKYKDEYRKGKFTLKLEDIKRKTEELYQRQTLYKDFLKEIPPSRVITLRNGEIVNGRHEFSAKMGISPVTFESIYYGYRLWLLELSTEINLFNNKLDCQNFFLKMQLLPNTGELWKTSVSFGFVEYMSSIYETDYKNLKPKYSPFLSSNVTIPSFYYSYISIYGDARKFSTGFNNYILYKYFRNKIGFLMQVDYIADKNFRNRFGDPVLFQIGIRFKPISNLFFTLSYEDHELFIFSTDFTIEKK